MEEKEIKIFDDLYEQISLAQISLIKSKELLEKAEKENKEKDNIIETAKIAVKTAREMNELHKRKLNLIDFIINDGDIHGGDASFIQSVLEAKNMIKLRQVEHTIKTWRNLSNEKPSNDGIDKLAHLADIVKKFYGDVCDVRIVKLDEEGEDE